MAFLCSFPSSSHHSLSKLFSPSPSASLLYLENAFLKLPPFRNSNPNFSNHASFTVRLGFGRLSYSPRQPEAETLDSIEEIPQLDSPILNQMLAGELKMKPSLLGIEEDLLWSTLSGEDINRANRPLAKICAHVFGLTAWLNSAQKAHSSEEARTNMVYETGELFELGIQLSYLLVLLGLLGVGTFFVIRQVLVRRELDLSAKELQEQVRSGDASATGYFELGAVMLRRKFYPAAIKYLQQAIEKWDGDDQDLAQVYNALGVSYVRDGKLEKGISQFENAVKLQPGYVTAWNNLGDAYEKKKDLRAALKAFEEVILFDPNNRVARPRRDALRERVQLYKGISIKSEDR